MWKPFSGWTKISVSIRQVVDFLPGLVRSPTRGSLETPNLQGEMGQLWVSKRMDGTAEIPTQFQTFFWEPTYWVDVSTISKGSISIYGGLSCLYPELTPTTSKYLKNPSKLGYTAHDHHPTSLNPSYFPNPKN